MSVCMENFCDDCGDCFDCEPHGWCSRCGHCSNRCTGEDEPLEEKGEELE